MKKDETKQKKKTHWRKIIIPAVVLLLFVIGTVYILSTQESKPDPASEKVIREAAARKLRKDPNELTDEDFARISRIDLSKQQLSDIKLLEIFSNLQDLSLNHITFPESKIPKWMKVLAQLNMIDLNKRFAIDLSPLENLSQLTMLDIQNCPVKSFEPLAKLENLQYLDIFRTEISDIEPLKKLTNLKHLYAINCLNITDKQIKDLQEALPELKIDYYKADNFSFRPIIPRVKKAEDFMSGSRDVNSYE